MSGFGLFSYFDNVASGVDTDARGMARRAETEVEFLKRRVETLEFCMMAAWEILSEHLQISPENLKAKLKEIDLRDGVEDGRVQQHLNECPHCHRRLLSRISPKCAWCGRDLAPI
ncbi:MAG: hypothetical protein JST40_11510 [Armatimonadetes bacterium]|nr:hypothetical protein [Armatimonadota bacterium]